MKLPFPLYVGLKYTGAKRRNRFISLVAFISMFGIMLGVTVLITVMSVMNGFHKELEERILGMADHVIVTDYGARLADWPKVREQVADYPGVAATAPYIDVKAMLTHRGLESFVLVKGILPEEQKEVSIVEDHMKAGELEDLQAGEYRVILGRGVAQSLGAAKGDKISMVIVEETRITPAGASPRIKRFTVSGIFETESEYDSNLAFIHMTDAGKLLRFGDKVSGLRIRTPDVLNAPVLSREISQALEYRYFVSDWGRIHGTLFRAAKMEKTMIFLLLTFIILIAAFNIVSTLVMLVTEKQSDIAILRTLGAAPGKIMRIFMVMGMINGLIGTILGLIFGILLSLNLPDIISWIERAFDVNVFQKGVYFINYLPTDLRWDDVAMVCGVAVLTSLLATLYPAWRASRTQPAEALRYE